MTFLYLHVMEAKQAMDNYARFSSGHVGLEKSAFYRAVRSYKARCDRLGLIFNQPASESSGFEDDGRVFVLRNVNGVIARFSHTPETSRLRYVGAADDD